MKIRTCFSESTEAASNYVAPELALPCTLGALHRCTPSTSCSSSASVILRIASKINDTVEVAKNGID